MGERSVVNRLGLTSLASVCSPVVPTAAGSPRWGICHDTVAPAWGHPQRTSPAWSSGTLTRTWPSETSPSDSGRAPYLPTEEHSSNTTCSYGNLLTYFYFSASLVCYTTYTYLTKKLKISKLHPTLSENRIHFYICRFAFKKNIIIYQSNTTSSLLDILKFSNSNI